MVFMIITVVDIPILMQIVVDNPILVQMIIIMHLPALACDLLMEGGVVVGAGGEHCQRDVCSLVITSIVSMFQLFPG